MSFQAKFKFMKAEKEKEIKQLQSQSDKRERERQLQEQKKIAALEKKVRPRDLCSIYNSTGTHIFVIHLKHTMHLFL